jgi:thioredoxin 1
MSIYIIIALITGAIAYFYFASRKITSKANLPQSEKITNLTETNFQHQTRNGIVLIDFWASWCMPCKVMAPILNDLAEETRESAQICKVNVEEEQKLSARYLVKNIPTLILLKNGKEISRFVGVKQKDFLLKQIRNIS